MRAWDDAARLPRSLVAADPEIAARLDAEALDGVFDLEASVHHVDTVFERLHELVGREEPVDA